MTPNGRDNYCCGGGGGPVSIDEIHDFRMAVGGSAKAEQIRATGADIVVAPCANCKKQLKRVCRALRARRAGRGPARPDPARPSTSTAKLSARTREAGKGPLPGQPGQEDRMDPWLDFARGPLFAIALAHLLLGLASGTSCCRLRLVSTMARDAAAASRCAPRPTRWRWLFPCRHCCAGDAVLSFASVLVPRRRHPLPLFLAGHVVAVERGLPGLLPTARSPRPWRTR